MNWWQVCLINCSVIGVFLVISTIFYRQFFKRFFDFILALMAIVFLSWIYLILAILIYCKLGSPIIFVQIRPGKKDKNGKEKLFKLYKFRTMTDERDCNGNLLPDSQRLTKFGKWLRSTSLDELPEIFNILKGDMSIIGPRPQLVRDMVFMSDTHRERHNIRPGLSGLAQISGRNAISWEGKLDTDLIYLKKISLWGDLRIIFETIIKVFKREGINEEGMATAMDYGDYLLENGKISEEEYNKKQIEAKNLLEGKYR